jgi:hypothetical protein
MRGYAITVDLGDGRMLFVVDQSPALADPATRKALLPKGANFSQLPLTAFKVSAGLPSELAAAIQRLRNSGKSVDIPLDTLPMIVRFREINNRSSIEELDPRDLTVAFGSGVRLQRAKLEITNDPISPMPSIWPEWLAEERGRAFTLQNPSWNLFRTISPSTKNFKGE